MAKWDCFGKVVGSKYLGQVDAETEEEAKQKIAPECFVSLCHHCAGECEDPEIDEITVEPAFITRGD